MTKYVCVKAPPAALGKGEHVIAMPDFVAEVTGCRQKLPIQGLTTTTILHDLINFIDHKYEANFPGSGIFVLNDYKGIPFSSAADIAPVVKKIFSRCYPKFFDSFIDYQIKHRPFGTQLIYFVGDHTNTGAFAANGVDMIDEKDVDIYMGRKEKKPNKGHFGSPKKTDESENLV
jgi:hypothetical protein